MRRNIMPSGAARVYGQGVTRRGGFEMNFVDWNLFDDTEAWREVTLGTKDERKTKMQDPEMRRRLKGEWDSGIRPTTVVARSVGSLIVQNQERKDRYRCGIDVSDVARAGRGRRCVLLPDQAPRRLQAVVEGMSASGRHRRGRGGAQFVCHNHGHQYEKDGGKCLSAGAPNEVVRGS
jgi:hypothetical protein